ncbi:MAG TPA: DUF5329 family protein [Fibrobacteria bacterium]|jgi:hypothetical protein|nr:DUF5329 family protein [Fibrobacteria bacterium]
MARGFLRERAFAAWVLPLLTLWLAGAFAEPFAAPGGDALRAPLPPRVEIDSLLAFVGRQQGIAFIRNGTSHTAEEAEAHLRHKLERAGSRVKTAEDFIRYCATRSFITRIPYRVRDRNGHTRLAADVLHEELKRLRAR